MKHNHHGHGALFAMGDLISGITGGDGGWSGIDFHECCDKRGTTYLYILTQEDSTIKNIPIMSYV